RRLACSSPSACRRASKTSRLACSAARRSAAAVPSASVNPMMARLALSSSCSRACRRAPGGEGGAGRPGRAAPAFEGRRAGGGGAGVRARVGKGGVFPRGGLGGVEPGGNAGGARGGAVEGLLGEQPPQHTGAARDLSG